MHILIVDDSRAMRMIIQRTLRQAGFTDHTVKEAASGKEALELLRGSPADVVLSDWNMPVMNGLELLEEIKRQGLGLQFGFITSEGTPAMRQVAIASGARFLLAKPFTVEAFEQALRGVLSA